MDNEVFFLLDDEPHLLFLEAGCPSVGVLGSDVPLNATVQKGQCHFTTRDSLNTEYNFQTCHCTKTNFKT